MTSHVPAAAFAASAETVAPSVLVEREPFLAALKLANRIVERRNSTPVLSNVHVSPSDSGGMRIVGTDLDIQCELEIEAAWGGPGDFTVDAAALCDVVKKTPARSQITMTVGEGNLTVTAGRVRTSLPMLPADDFPILAFPDSGAATAFDIPSDQLARDLAALAPAMSSDEQRYYLCGAALQITEIAGSPSLAMISTDGSQMVRIARPIPPGAESMADAILPRKLVSELLRALKKRAPGALAVEIGGSQKRFRLTGPGLRITSKLIDGTFPNWRTAYDKAVGEGGLQGVAMIELDPRLNARQIATLSKAAGAPMAVETGEFAAVLTAAGFPEYIAISMFMNEDAERKGFGFNEYEHAGEHARRYAEALGLAAGLPKFTESRARYECGLVVGATFGNCEYVKPEPVQVVDWTRIGASDAIQTIQPEPFQRWEDGAYSVPLPKSHATFASVEIVGDDGETAIQPVRTNRGGELELSEKAIAVMVGDLGERVEIAPLQFLHGEVVTGFTFPGRPKVSTGKATGRRFRPMTDREQLAAYCANPAAFMNRVSAQPCDYAETMAVIDEFATVVMSLPVPEPSNVIPVDFAAAAAARAQAATEEAEKEAASADVVQSSELAALAARVAALEGRIAAGTAPSPVPAAPDPTVQDPALAIEAGERAELVAEIDRLRALVANQAATIHRLQSGRDRAAGRLRTHREALKRERALTTRLLGQVADMLKHREPRADSEPLPAPPVDLPASLRPPPIIALPVVPSRPRELEAVG